MTDNCWRLTSSQPSPRISWVKILSHKHNQKMNDFGAKTLDKFDRPYLIPVSWFITIYHFLLLFFKDEHFYYRVADKVCQWPVCHPRSRVPSLACHKKWRFSSSQCFSHPVGSLCNLELVNISEDFYPDSNTRYCEWGQSPSSKPSRSS